MNTHSPAVVLNQVFVTRWTRLLTAVGLAPPLRVFAYVLRDRPGCTCLAVEGYPWKFRRAMNVVAAAGWQIDEIWMQWAPGLLRSRWDVVIPRKAGVRA